MKYEIVVYLDTELDRLKKVDIERIKDVIQSVVPMANVDLREVEDEC